MISYQIRTREDGTPIVNDNGTVQVEINIDGKLVNQDFASDSLDEDVKKAIVVLRHELANNVIVLPDIQNTEPVSVKVADLPTIPTADFQQEGE